VAKSNVSSGAYLKRLISIRLKVYSENFQRSIFLVCGTVLLRGCWEWGLKYVMANGRLPRCLTIGVKHIERLLSVTSQEMAGLVARSCREWKGCLR
jgi:hypothetical protein